MEVSLIGTFTLHFTIVMKTDLLGALDFSLWSICTLNNSLDYCTESKTPSKSVFHYNGTFTNVASLS